MMKASKSRFAITAAIPSLFGCMPSGAQQDDLPEVVAQYISEHYTNSRLMSVNDVNRKSCANLGEISTLLKGDFDRNGKMDYAFLVVTNISETKTTWAGAELRGADIELVVLLADAKNRSDGKVLERLSGYLPSDVFIQLRAPGTITRSDNSSIELQSYGIARIHCEKSESIFYWDKTTFRQDAIAD